MASNASGRATCAQCVCCSLLSRERELTFCVHNTFNDESRSFSIGVYSVSINGEGVIRAIYFSSCNALYLCLRGCAPFPRLLYNRVKYSAVTSVAAGVQAKHAIRLVVSGCALHLTGISFWG